MPLSEQQQWAAQFHKSRRTSLQQLSIPRETQKKQIQEEIEYYKKQAATTGMVQIEKLTTLRARLLSLALGELKELYGTVPQDDLMMQIRKYYTDCGELVKAAAILSLSPHGNA